jgi:hypothetical protein
MPKPPTRDQIRLAFAQTVRSLRLKARISQERLALNLGIDRGNTAGLERGLHTPRLYTILRLLPGLHVTFIEFAGEFERTLHTKGGAGGRTTCPRRHPRHPRARQASSTMPSPEATAGGSFSGNPTFEEMAVGTSSQCL